MRPDEHRGARAPRPRRGLRRVACAAGTALLIILGAPWAAEASLIDVDPITGVATYVADPTEANELVVTAGPGFVVFTDQFATITADPGECVIVDPAEPRQARCDATGLFVLAVQTNALRNTVEIDESVYSATSIVFTDVDAGDGNDFVVTGSGPDVIAGRDGIDTIDSGAGTDDVDGHEGADVIDSGPGDDEVDGQDGDDDIAAGDGNDTISGDAGNDILDSGPADDRLIGGQGADTLLGGDGDDNLDGGPEDDREPDVLSGGGGSDTLDYSSRTSPLVVTIDRQANDGAIGEGDNVAGDIDSIVAGSESDTLTGSANPERLDGGPGDDLIDGAGGDDTIIGGLDSGSDGLSGGVGNDTVRGGAGDDSLAGGPGTDDLGAGGGSDALTGDGDGDTLAGGPGLDALDGGDGDDILRGADVVLVGADGADDIAGGAGSDTVLGGPGNDTLDGGLGPDSLRGEAGRDTVTYRDRATPVTVTLDDLANDGEAGEGDNVASDVEAVEGGTVGDTLRGNPASNQLDGASGPDYIDAATGVDTISGGSARDALRSRDGARDSVSCGGGVDFAIVDPADVVRDCERVDDGTRRRPAALREAVLAPTRGELALRLPGSPRFIPIQERLIVPLGATVDARRGTARLVTAPKRRAPVQAARFNAGRFRIGQTRGPRPVTVIRLTGGNLGRCAQLSNLGAAHAAQAPRRRLWGRVGKRRGRYRTRGDHSSGTVRGTVWLTEDRCDGTLTRVVSGTVAVRDFGLRRTVLVHAGERYLARSR
jgi:Ca2+-binding RTX toxin-like protein